MLRFLLVVAAGLLSSVRVAQGVDVATEYSQINTAFAETMRAAEDKRGAFAKASSERTAALEKLAAAAEAEKSTEHRLLAQIYLLLQRADDAGRQARAALKADEKDLSARSILVQSLMSGNQSKEALQELQTLLKVEVDDKNAAAFLSAAMASMNVSIRSLTAAEKFAEAEQLLGDWSSKLEGMKSDDAAVKSAVENVKRSLPLMKSQLASAKVRAELIGKSYSPLENPTWLNGDPITSEQLHGKVVLLDFWAVWCGPCIATFPHLIEWQEKYGDKGLVIIGVTKRYHYGWNAEEKRPEQQRDIEAAKEDAATLEFAKHHGLKHRLAVMPEGDASSRNYAVTGIPQVVVIDQSGVIRLIRVGSGEKTAHDVEAEIRKLLGLEVASASK